MSGISISFSGVSEHVATIAVRVSGGEFLIEPGAGFALPGGARSITVTADSIHFSPTELGPSHQYSAGLSIGLRAALGADPVIEIDADLGTLGRMKAAQEAAHSQIGAQVQGIFGQNPGFLPFGMGGPMPGSQMPFGLGSQTPEMAPPPLPKVEQSITVEWTTASGRRSAKAAIGTPLTLEGFAG